MDLTTLDRFMDDGGVTKTRQGLIVTINPKWIVEGEDRLSYTTLVRMVECCRELHWNSDVLIHGDSLDVDSITKLISGDFQHPIQSGTTVSISYRVTAVGQKSYALRFEVRNTAGNMLCATMDITSVFYDPIERRALVPPQIILDHLSEMVQRQEREDTKK